MSNEDFVSPRGTHGRLRGPHDVFCFHLGERTNRRCVVEVRGRRRVSGGRREKDAAVSPDFLSVYLPLDNRTPPRVYRSLRNCQERGSPSTPDIQEGETWTPPRHCRNWLSCVVLVKTHVQFRVQDSLPDEREGTCEKEPRAYGTTLLRVRQDTTLGVSLLDSGPVPTVKVYPRVVCRSWSVGRCTYRVDLPLGGRTQFDGVDFGTLVSTR